MKQVMKGFWRGGSSKIILGTLMAVGLVACPSLQSDMTISKRIKTIPVVSGQPNTYILSIGNNGPVAGFGVVVSDMLPAGVTYTGPITSTSGNWNCVTSSLPNITCNYSGVFAVGSNDQIFIPVNVTAKDGVIKNCAFIKSLNSDPKPGNNESCTQNDVLPSNPPEKFDLEIKKSVAKAPMQIGQPNTYTLVVTNLGPGISTAPVQITDNLPSGVVLNGTVTALPASPVFNCTTAVVCTSVAPMLPNTSVTITIPVLVTGNTQGVPFIRNCASVAATGDGNPQNDNACIDTETIPADDRFDLEIKKDLKTKPAVAGQPNSYVLTVTNLGPGASSFPISIIDNVPSGVTVTSTPTATPASAGFSCTTAVLCTSSTQMAAGASVQIIIPVIVNQDQGILENCATVQATGDTNPQNDRDCVFTDIVPGKPRDMAIRKQLLGATSLPAGGVGTYQLNILNLGGVITAGPVVMTDNIPGGLTLITSSIVVTPAADWDCATNSTPTLLSCIFTGTSFPIPTGYSSTIKFNVQVAGGFIGSVKNCAKVTVATDVVPSNNVSCIKNPIKNVQVSDSFELALTDAMTQLEDYIETSPDEAEAMRRATSGLKDTLKTQVRLMPDLTLEPVGTDENSFNAIFQGAAGTSPIKLSIKVDCQVTYPPLKVGCVLIITL